MGAHWVGTIQDENTPDCYLIHCAVQDATRLEGVAPACKSLREQGCVLCPSSFAVHEPGYIGDSFGLLLFVCL